MTFRILLCVVTASLAAHAGDQPANVSKPIPRGNLPARVHAFEDFETDIEKRWWLVGKPETENVPFSSSRYVPNTRCMRAGESKNFDDKMEDRNKIWKAVIFNPVPGPPMGANTRLSFRYWLKGTTNLRVQIFSLTNNYHRCLTLTDLPQERWLAATVDMTEARRPDGSGGPLSLDERIDDIQFYIQRDAELLIDDIILYEAAPNEERRPFPRRIIFTGWFDTGKQGVEWPGKFEIVPHEKPLTWKFAHSVADKTLDCNLIAVNLRGMRPVSQDSEIRFRYRLTGGDSLNVRVCNGKDPLSEGSPVRVLTQDEWAVARFKPDAQMLGAAVDTIQFTTNAQAQLSIDDVLYFEPGE